MTMSQQASSSYADEYKNYYNNESSEDSSSKMMNVDSSSNDNVNGEDSTSSIHRPHSPSVTQHHNQQPQQQQQRRRSLSLAEPQPNVETVITKAKRAAQSLWMLLHAQVNTYFSPFDRQLICICHFYLSLTIVCLLYLHIFPFISSYINMMYDRVVRWVNVVLMLVVKKQSYCICI
jgi:hypothetical protein